MGRRSNFDTLSRHYIFQRDQYFEKWIDSDCASFESGWEKLRSEDRAVLLAMCGNQEVVNQIIVRANWSHPSKDQWERLEHAGFVDKSWRKELGLRIGALLPKAYGFVDKRIGRLLKYRLLTPNQCDVEQYLRYEFNSAREKVILKLLNNIIQVGPFKDCLWRFVRRGEWIDMLEKSLDQANTTHLLNKIRENGGKMFLSDLVAFQENGRAGSRSKILKLLELLVLCEDLDLETLRLQIGFGAYLHRTPPSVPAALVRPPRIDHDFGTKVPLVEDVRVLLLEIANKPPLVKDSGELYQKEYKRLSERLDDLPQHAGEELGGGRLERVSTVIAIGRQCSWVKRQAAKNSQGDTLVLSQQGQDWLSMSPWERYQEILKTMNPKTKDKYWSEEKFWFKSLAFALISDIKSVNYLRSDKIDLLRDTFRQLVYKRLHELPKNQWITLESVIEYLALGPKNPLYLDRNLGEVVVKMDDFVTLPFASDYEWLAKRFFTLVFLRQLLPMGCFSCAVHKTELLVKRQPLMELYFGEEVPKDVFAGMDQNQGKVVVQPDYSIIIIGDAGAAAAELAEFCEVSPGKQSGGAMTLRLTREAIFNAVANGLDARSVGERLRHHATGKLPANVAKQVEEWAAWPQRAQVSTATLIECPSREVGDRVMAVLGIKALRVNDEEIVVRYGELSTQDHVRLRKSGIVIRKK